MDSYHHSAFEGSTLEMQEAWGYPIVGASRECHPKANGRRICSGVPNIFDSLRVKEQQYIAEGYRWVVDLDLEKFFDRVNHDRLLAAVAARVADKRMLKLIRAFLEAGVMEDLAARTASRPHGPWRLAHSPALNIALPNAYFAQLGLPPMVVRP